MCPPLCVDSPLCLECPFRWYSHGLNITPSKSLVPCFNPSSPSACPSLCSCTACIPLASSCPSFPACLLRVHPTGAGSWLAVHCSASHKECLLRGRCSRDICRISGECTTLHSFFVTRCDTEALPCCQVSFPMTAL